MSRSLSRTLVVISRARSTAEDARQAANAGTWLVEGDHSPVIVAVPAGRLLEQLERYTAAGWWACQVDDLDAARALVAEGATDPEPNTDAWAAYLWSPVD